MIKTKGKEKIKEAFNDYKTELSVSMAARFIEVISLELDDEKYTDGEVLEIIILICEALRENDNEQVEKLLVLNQIIG